MSRARVATLVVAGSLLGLGVMTGGASPSDAQPFTVPPTPVPTTVAPTTAPTSVAPTTAVAVTTTPVPPRVGTGDVDAVVVKDESEIWSLRRIATTVGIAVVALAILGFAYGKVRSSARRSTSSALVASSE